VFLAKLEVTLSLFLRNIPKNFYYTLMPDYPHFEAYAFTSYYGFKSLSKCEIIIPESSIAK
jgi:hypothetical protein